MQQENRDAARSKIQGVVQRAGTARAPDFFGVGAEKCGTTWLWQMFRDHPDIGVPVPKELRFFAHRSLNTGFENFSALQKLLTDHRTAPRTAIFLERVATELRIAFGGDQAYLKIFGALVGIAVGDVSPQYCLLPDDGVAHMKSLAPNAKIIFMIRDPVDRAISGGKMNARKVHDTLTDDTVREVAMNSFQLGMSRYSGQLDKFEKYFPGRVFTGFLEDVIAQPLALLEQLCKFLEVPFDASYFKRLDIVSNAGSAFSAGAALKQELFAELRPEYHQLAERFPERVASWVAKYETI